MGPCLGNGRDDAGALHTLEALQFVAQLLSTDDRQRIFIHLRSQPISAGVRPLDLLRSREQGTASGNFDGMEFAREA